MKSIGYGRISSTRSDGASLLIQREDYQTYAERVGYEDQGWYQDDGVSGGKVDRDGLNAALKACRDVGGAVLIARDLSRIGRNVALLGRLSEALDSGDLLGIETTHDMKIGTGSQAKLVLGIMMSIAESQRTETSERLKRRNEHNRALGIPHTGGSRPFGFERDKVTPRADEGAVIFEAVDKILAGASLTSVTKDMNRAGHRTSTGREWKYQSLKAMLERDYMVHLLGDKAQAVRDVIKARGRKYGTRPSVFTRYLSGVLVCGNCAKTLKSHSSNGKPSYGCTEGCNSIWITADPLETLIGRFVQEMAVPGVTPGEDYRGLLTEREEMHAKIERLQGLYLDGDLEKAAYKKRHAKLTVEADRIDADLSAHSASAALAGSVETWENLDAGQRRAVVLDLLGPLTVKKSEGIRNSRGQLAFRWQRIAPERPEVANWWRLWSQQSAA